MPPRIWAIALTFNVACSIRSLPLAVLHRQGAEAGGGIALVLLMTCALYFASLARFGGRLDRKRERIAEALS